MSRTIRFFTLVIILILALSGQGLAPTHAAGLWYVSTSGSDAKACNTPATACRTINAAIAKAQAADFINVAAGVYTAPGKSEVVLVNKNYLVIQGGWNNAFSKADGYSILDGQHERRGLTVTNGVSIQISNFALVHGFAVEGGGAAVDGILYGSHLLVALNRAFRGGGIFVGGSAAYQGIELSSSALFGNEYYDRGGGLFLSGSGAISQFENVTVSSNTSINSVDDERGTPPTYGGGVFVDAGLLQIVSSTFADNTTFDGKQFTEYMSGMATGKTKGGIFLARDVIEDGCAGGTVSFGYNLESGNTCYLSESNYDKLNVDLRLLQLGVYGGNTATHALAPDSPAIDIVSDPNCGASPDQRGIQRPQGSACDAGAFERKADDLAKDIFGSDACQPDATGLVPLGCSSDLETLLATLLNSSSADPAQPDVAP